MMTVTGGGEMRSRPSAIQVTRIFILTSTVISLVVGHVVLRWGPLTLVLVGIVPFTLLMLLPSGSALMPWRIFLPALTAYNAVALMLEDPGTVDSQVDLLFRFIGGYVVGSILAYAVPAPMPTGGRRPERFAVHHGALSTVNTIGVLAMVLLFVRRGGPPILASNPATARVELADFAILYVTAQVCLEIVIVIDLLRLRGIARVDGPRARYLHTLVALTLLFATAGRSQFLIPVAFVVFCLIMSGWRRFTTSLVVAALAGAAFLTVGNFREGGAAARGITAPATDYMQGTVQEEHMAIQTFPDEEAFTGGRLFFWMYYRVTDPSSGALPPGLVLRDEFNRTGTFEGFGLEPGIITAWYVDWGVRGVLVGGMIVGLVSQYFYRRWRRRGGWAMVAYAYMLIWLMLSIVVHPVASYFFVIMPGVLVGLWWASRNLESNAGERSHAASELATTGEGRE